MLLLVGFFVLRQHFIIIIIITKPLLWQPDVSATSALPLRPGADKDLNHDYFSQEAETTTAIYAIQG